MSDLWQRVSEHLSGKAPVEVEFRGTSIKGFTGEAYKAGKNYKIILIPWMSDKKKLAFFLHETAHHRLEELKDTLKHPLHELINVPGSLDFDAEDMRNHRQDPIEAQAWEQAKAWLEYSGHWGHLYPGHTALDKKLNCLLEYPAKEK